MNNTTINEIIDRLTDLVLRENQKAELRWEKGEEGEQLIHTARMRAFKDALKVVKTVAIKEETK